MKENNLGFLENLPFFSRASLLAMDRISDNALNQNLGRWVRNGRLIRLKNGLFVTSRFRDRALNSPGYIELLAGSLLTPSYLSLEVVLQKHGLLTEATYAVTSMTTKSGRRFSNTIGTFVYHSIHEDLYFGFNKKTFGKNIYFEASIGKALFDFLYLRLPQLDPSNSSAIAELRLNWDLLSPESFCELGDIIRRSEIKKMITIYHLISREFYGHAR